MLKGKFVGLVVTIVGMVGLCVCVCAVCVSLYVCPETCKYVNMCAFECVRVCMCVCICVRVDCFKSPTKTNANYTLLN